jgi:hypothetical protein
MPYDRFKITLYVEIGQDLYNYWAIAGRFPSGSASTLGCRSAGEQWCLGQIHIREIDSDASNLTVSNLCIAIAVCRSAAVPAAFERFTGVGDKSDIKNSAAFLRRFARNLVLDYYRAARARRRPRRPLRGRRPARGAPNANIARPNVQIVLRFVIDL